MSFDDGPVLDTIHFDTLRFPPPPWALEAFAAAARDGSNAYTPNRGNPQVLAQLAPRLQRLLGIPVDPEREIVLTPGTQAGIFTSTGALASDGLPVVLIDPDYLDTARILRFLKAEVTRVPLVRSASGLQPDLDALENALDRRSLLIFSNPNNPTGAVFSEQVVERIADLVERSGSYVIADELYTRLTYDAPMTHLVACDGMRDRCITLLGPSKTESLTGYRVGVVTGPAPLLEQVEDVLSFVALRAPAYAQHVLRHWLHDDEDWLRERLREFRSLRDMTVQRLTELEWLRLEPPAGAAYVFPDVAAAGVDDETLGQRLLDEARVRVIPGCEFGDQGVGHFRMCFARDERQWEDALGRILDVLASLAPAGVAR